MTSRRAPAIFNWAGSKARVAKTLSGLNLPSPTVYHEPFLGSGAAFLGLASAGLITRSLLSDINPRLTAVFQATQMQPHEVVSGLRMHALLDSDVHFSAVLGRLNARPTDATIDCQAASDSIYLLSQSFHSTWYETLGGQVSMSRRRDTGKFRARHQDVIEASALLRGATVSCTDFQAALSAVRERDLVFLDPPYLHGSDQSDRQGYNAERFTVTQLQALSAEMKRLVDIGAHVIFCWCERVDGIVPGDGGWIAVGRDYVWLSEALSIGRKRPAATVLTG
jgi:DNA adenine methylase